MVVRDIERVRPSRRSAYRIQLFPKKGHGDDSLTGMDIINATSHSERLVKGL